MGSKHRKEADSSGDGETGEPSVCCARVKRHRSRRRSPPNAHRRSAVPDSDASREHKRPKKEHKKDKHKKEKVEYDVRGSEASRSAVISLPPLI